MRFDFSDPEVLHNPYRFYERSRAKDGLMRLGPGQWGVTRYSDVSALLNAPELGSFLPRGALNVSHPNKRVAAFLQNIVLFQDPPAHGALRRTLAPATGAASLRHVVHKLPTLVEEVVQELDLNCDIDVMQGLAIPLASQSLAELLRIEPEKGTVLADAAKELSRVFITSPTDEDLTAGAKALSALEQAVDQTMLTSIVLQDICQRAKVEGVTQACLRDNLVFLFFAGFETTASMIGNTVAWLLADGTRQHDMRSGEISVPDIVAQAICDDPPIQGVARVLKEDFDVAGRPLRAGRVLVLYLASANRDGSEMLSFGGGRHKCPGADLATGEIEAVLRWIMKATDWMLPAGQWLRNSDSRIRSYAALPVRFDVP